MVAAVSATTSTVLTSSTSSTVSQLKAELAAKQSELASAKTDDEKSEINSEIAKLKTALAKAEAKDKGSDSTSSTSTSTASGSATASKVLVTAADRAAPESRVSNAAMDVLMTLGSPGGEASDGAEADAGMPPSLSALYAEMDSDDDRSLSTAEFIAGNRDRMGEDAAGGVFDALDSEGTGALSEDQFIAGAGRGRPDGNPPIGPRPGWPMQADDGQSLA